MRVGEKPVGLDVAKLSSRHFMLVAKKTKAVLYGISLSKDLKNSLIPICGIHLNSAITSTGVMNARLYNLFFTAAYLLPLFSRESRLKLTKNASGDLGDAGRKRSDAESKTTKVGLSDNTGGKEEMFERTAEAARRKGEREREKLMVYLADSNAFLHVYCVANLLDH